MIPIGVMGEVENGPHPGMKVEIESDGASGYHILKWWVGSKGLGPNGVFDDWVQSRNELEEYFQEAGWSVRWATSSNDAAVI
jgi:hypothetical protein